MNIVYGIIATIVFLGLLLTVFMAVYNIYIQFKERKEFDIEYRKEQERIGKSPLNKWSGNYPINNKKGEKQWTK